MMRRFWIFVAGFTLMAPLTAAPNNADEPLPIKPDVDFKGSEIHFSLPNSMPQATDMEITIVGPGDEILLDQSVEARFFSWSPASAALEGVYRYEVRPALPAATNGEQTVERVPEARRLRFRAGSFKWIHGQLIDLNPSPALPRERGGDRPSPLTSGVEGPSQESDLFIDDPTPWLVFNDTDGEPDASIRFNANSPPHFRIVHGAVNVMNLETDAGADTADSITVNATGDVGLSDGTLFVDRSLGTVGIGTTVPAYSLHIKSSFPTIRLDNTEFFEGRAVLQMGNNVLEVVGNSFPQKIVNIDTRAPADSLWVANNGNVGIGDPNPSHHLTIHNETNGADLKLSGVGQEYILGIRLGSGDFVIQGSGGAAEDVLRIRPGIPDEFLVVDPGGLGVGTAFPTATLHVAGNGRIDGDVALGSSRTLKTAFDAVDPAEMLAKVADLPLASWRYKTEEESKRHIGPFAEDFQRLFGLGDGETISVIDAQGVAFAAIQGLQQALVEKDAEVAALRQADAEREAQLVGLRKQVEALTAALASR